MAKLNQNLFNLCSGFFRYEEFLEKKLNTFYNEGYLIEKDVIEKLKKDIFYDKLKSYSNYKEYNFCTFITNTEVKKYLNKYNGIEENIIEVKFKNGEELINSLKNNKKYYLINKPLWTKIKICNNEYNIGKGIPFLFKKDNIILNFKYKKKVENLYFININGGIIEESSFIENKSNYNKSLENEGDEEYIKGENTLFNDNFILSNFKYKIEIEILIRLYYFNKELKEKKNMYSCLLYYNKETVYLINKLWIEKFKNFFEYKEIELILEKIDISTTLYQDKNLICDYFIEEIISYFPQNYFITIIKKNKNDFYNKPVEYDYNKIDASGREIQYLINNQIINSQIYELLNSLEYNIANQIKATDLYFIENNELLLLFKNSSEDISEIGHINEENLFIPEFIFYNNENNISTNILNNFFSTKFSEFKSNHNQIHIKFSHNKSNIYCYKLNNSMEIQDNQNNNLFDISNLEDIEEFKNDSVNQKSMNLRNKDYNELLYKIKDKIKISLLLFLFDKYIENKIKLSSVSKDVEDYKNCIVNDKGYLLNKNWIYKFKQIYLYNKISEFFDKKELPKINDNMEEIILDIFYNNKNKLKNINNDNFNIDDIYVYPESLNLEKYNKLLYF